MLSVVPVVMNMSWDIFKHCLSFSFIFFISSMHVASANKQVVALSEELARKVEDSLRQQEEISSLLGQVVDLQQRCKGVGDAMWHICKTCIH